jgi:hypothetical protein
MSFTQMGKPGQNAPDLKQNKLLGLKTQLNAANESVKTFENKIDRLRAAEPRVTEKVVEKPAPPDAEELERLVSERVAERAGALEKARREADAERVSQIPSVSAPLSTPFEASGKN